MANDVLLLITLLVCHYLADFCLTTPSMIRAKADGRQWKPIFGHAAVHALLIAASLLMFYVEIRLTLILMVFELVTHFAVDTAKGRLTACYPSLANQRQKPYWILYGLDQLIHQLVIVAIWYLAITK